MQYMLLVFGEEHLWEALPRDDEAAIRRSSDELFQRIVTSNHPNGTTGLQPASTATTLRQGQGKLVITDGPVTPAGEVLSAFQLIDCANLDEAIAVASRLPALRFGFSIEVRPVIPQ